MKPAASAHAPFGFNSPKLPAAPPPQPGLTSSLGSSLYCRQSRGPGLNPFTSGETRSSDRVRCPQDAPSAQRSPRAGSIILTEPPAPREGEPPPRVPHRIGAVGTRRLRASPPPLTSHPPLSGRPHLRRQPPAPAPAGGGPTAAASVAREPCCSSGVPGSAPGAGERRGFLRARRGDVTARARLPVRRPRWRVGGALCGSGAAGPRGDSRAWGRDPHDLVSRCQGRRPCARGRPRTSPPTGPPYVRPRNPVQIFAPTANTVKRQLPGRSS